MRILVPSLLLTALCLSAAGEVIHLKNGRTIWADHVRENAGHVEYDVGDDTYAIPKSLVERIDAGGSAPVAPSSGREAHDLPAFVPNQALPIDASLVSKIISNDAVDDDALLDLEKAGNARATAAGYFLAGKHELERANFPGARKYLDTALRFDGQNPTILNYYAAVLVRTGNGKDALSYAERAVRIAPDSPDTLTVLGFAQYASDHEQDAILTWKKSLELRPDATVKAMLARAERDSAAQTNYSEHESSHFTLHYEGSKTSESLREQVLETLEVDYDDLLRQFGSGPQNISVVLYTDHAFFDVTQAPSWTGAVNDGKLRIPVQGVNTITSDLARVLKHELAHSFINQLSNGRCPQWLNEGLAQSVEPRRLSNGARLAELFAAQQEIPLNMLEANFMRYTGMEARLAYDESLAAVQYIQDTNGMTDLQRVLQRLGEGNSTEAALRETIHADYAQLEADIGKYLATKYGH